MRLRKAFLKYQYHSFILFEKIHRYLYLLWLRLFLDLFAHLQGRQMAKAKLGKSLILIKMTSAKRIQEKDRRQISCKDRQLYKLMMNH